MLSLWLKFGHRGSFASAELVVVFKLNYKRGYRLVKDFDDHKLGLNINKTDCGEDQSSDIS